MTRIFAALLALALALPAQAAGLRTQVEDYRAAHEAQIVGDLASLIQIPSVHARKDGLVAMADRLKSLLAARGFATQTWQEPGEDAPTVFGEYKVAGARRTVLFYAHYDGQPVVPAQWSSDPFTPVMRDGAKDVDWKTAKSFDPQWRLYGRAGADDKVTIAAFLAAFDALKAAGRKPSVNIKLLWEGDEEIGSPHLPQTLAAHAKDLVADVLLLGDGPVHQSRKPTLYFGARGGTGVEATVFGPAMALHDGHYGNWAPNPAVLAADLITQLRDDKGHILVPGFYDDVRPLTPAERAAIAALPPVENDLKREFGFAAAESDEGLTLSTMRPALNVLSLRAGGTGAGVIPADATVTFSFRLVPGETPAHVHEMVEAYLKAKGWTIVTAPPDAVTRAAHPRIVQLRWGGGYPGFRSDLESAPARAVIAAAGRGAGQPVVVLPMMGAGVPMFLFDTALHIPVIGLPIANHDDAQHAANENIRLQNLWDGIPIYAAMMADLTW